MTSQIESASLHSTCKIAENVGRKLALLSRSFKRPFTTDSRHGRWKEKRFAAKKARRADFDGGRQHRKLYQSCYISDYSWYTPEFQEARRK
ncbi:MAG: hypothetical protein M0R06_18565 [Sphaerochaeta sp.]|nr:hypothetical protein [Sphaerochaeta sp.]